ncbi:MAG: 1,4-dihydroxy-2-naphthoate octaprenyltransferase [Candidatus Krumholzibacteria bacterium]|nr:1,4-dihydroxy-2-naphthoate octaprenyltransferase [Candidatus Krumholzibacteria bacterium]
MARLENILKEFRAEFLTASVLPALLGLSVAVYETGRWEPLLFLLTLAGAVFLHIGTNVANDFFDHLSGADEANREFARPFTGGSRLIQEKRISPRGVLTIAVLFYLAAAAAGVLLIMARGTTILLFGLFGLFLGIFYTAPPVRLASRGAGEAAVGLGYGLITAGAYYVQTGTFSAASIAASVPLAFLVAAIVTINEFQDAPGDAAAGKNTLVVRLGRRRAVRFYSLLMIGGFVSIAAGAAFGLMPLLTFAALLPALLAARAISVARRFHDDPVALVPANVLTIACHLATGALLIAAFLISAARA